jgi:hypothetical protein
MGLRRKIAKAWQELPMEAERFLRGRYPRFVASISNRPLTQEVPVFMFHSVEHRLFEQQLTHLRRNGYRTLTIDQFMGFLRGEAALEGPSVLLTFDDGHKSWFDVAHPLLQAYGFCAVGFLVAGLIREAPDAGPWLSWPEILDMQRSGVMTFESHTARHEQVFVGPELCDFFHPGFNPSELALGTPWVDDEHGYTNRLRWGTPIYAHASRLADAPRLLDDAGVRNACQTWVEQHGGEAAFARPDWRPALTRTFQAARAAAGPPRWESPSEQRRAILAGLLEGRLALEEKLGRPVRHLCYPWGIAGSLARALSPEAGYLGTFGAPADGRRTNRSGDSLFGVPRVKDDYLFRLPGEGRRSLAQVFRAKLRRRAERLDIY